MQLNLTKVSELDRNIMLSVSKYRAKPITEFLKLVTYTAVGRAWFGAAIILNLLNFYNIQVVEKQTVFLNALFAPLLAWMLGHFLKKTFQRKRPFQCIDNYSALVNSPINDSFPSLHAGGTTAFFVALLILQHPLAIAVALWAALASFSRVYLGVHFLSDIIGGVLLGIFCGSLIFQITNLVFTVF